MLDYFFFLFCLLSITNLQIKESNNFFYDYMNLVNTNSIKGIFVWIIIFAHKRDYLINKNLFCVGFVEFLSQNMVAMFLFYSGFGIFESLKKKSCNYSKSLFHKAIILFLKTQIIILLYLVANIFILKYRVTLEKYLLSVILKRGLGNSFWFAFTIIILYIYCYLSFSFCKNIYLGLLFINFICLTHIYFVYNFYYPKSITPVETILCFLFGFYYSLFHRHSDKVLMKNDILYFAALSTIILIYYEFTNSVTIAKRSGRNLSFSLLVLLISMKVRLNNNFLSFLNSHSYSIYLLQRLVMIIVYRKRLLIKYDFIRMSFEFTSIFFIACLFDKYTHFIDKRFNRNVFKSKLVQYNIIDNIYLNNKGNVNYFSKENYVKKNIE